MTNDKPAVETAITAKWGDAGRAGWTGVPDLLLKNQVTLGLNATEMMVLLNVLMHWWYPDQKPFPRPTTIAKRMGSTTRTVQRALGKLREKKLLRREMTETGPVMDPSQLVARLSNLAQTDKDFLVRTRKFTETGGPIKEFSL